jgi:hypothetical protein
MRGCLYRFDECPARDGTLEATEFLRGDHDDFIPPMHGHVLGSLTANLADQLAEASLGILQEPITGSRPARLGFCAFGR